MQQEVNYRLGPCTAQKFPSLVEVLEPHSQAQVQGCPRDPSLSSHIRPSPDFPAQPVCNSPPRKSCFGTQGPIPGRRCVQPSWPGGSPRSGPTCQQKREREDGSGGAERQIACRGRWGWDGRGTDAGRTRYIPGNSPTASALPPEVKQASASQQEISNHFSDTKATGIRCRSEEEGLRRAKKGLARAGM